MESIDVKKLRQKQFFTNFIQDNSEQALMPEDLIPYNRKAQQAGFNSSLKSVDSAQNKKETLLSLRSVLANYKFKMRYPGYMTRELFDAALIEIDVG